MAELPGNFAANRNALARAPQVQQPLQRLAPQASNPPAPGTLAAMEAERQRLRDAPDMRHGARTVVDRVFAMAQEWVMQEHGRRLELDPWNQRSMEAELAMKGAQRAAESFIAVSLSPHASKSSIAHMLDQFCQSVSDGLAVVTAGWPSAAEYARQQQQAEEERWR